MDNNNPVSNPTANNSRFVVEGDRDAWTASISEAVMGILDKRRNGRGLLHSAFVYDFGLMLLGLPLGLYICWRLSGPIGKYLGSANSFLATVAYLYLMMLGLWLYRLMFGYTKWAFPPVELDMENQSSRHRAVWYAIMLGTLSGVIVELWKYLSF